MKVNVNSNRLVNAVLILALFVIGFQIYSIAFLEQGLTDNYYDSYTLNGNLNPIDSPLSTDLPYSRYITLSEKAQKIRDLKNGDWFESGGAQLGWIIGTSGSRWCDTCTIHNRQSMPGTEQYYITLPGWHLKLKVDELAGLDSLRFFVEGKQAYVRKPIIDGAKKTKDGTHYSAHFVDEPVKFRYSRRHDMVMIPVTKGTKQICTYVIAGLAIVLVLYMLFLIAAFAKFVTDLSKGLSFTANNINRLKLIAISLIGIPVVMFLLTLLVRLIFSSYLTDDVVLKPNTWRNSWLSLTAGVVFLLLYKAFTQGRALKEENDLTV